MPNAWRSPREVPAWHWLATVLVALGTVGVASRANAQRIAYSGSVQSATGDYLFTERTTSLSLFNGLSLGLGRLRFTATLPLLYQNSTAVTYIGGAPVPTGGPDAELVRQRHGGARVPMGEGGRGRHGTQTMGAVAAIENETAAEVVAEPGDFDLNLGDPLLQMDVDLHRGFGFVRSLTVNGVAKVPVADVESGIGTGEWDYGLGAMLSLGSGRTFLFTNATYWLLGDMADLPLKNMVSYGASLGRALGATGQWSVLGSVTGATTIVETSDPPLSAGIGVGYLRGGGDGINVGVMFGLSESSPDVSSYIGWHVPVGSRKR